MNLINYCKYPIYDSGPYAGESIMQVWLLTRYLRKGNDLKQIANTWQNK